MVEYNLIMNMFYKFIIFIAFMIVITEPEAVGKWLAMVDIGYDSIWSEYVSDCECSETL